MNDDDFRTATLKTLGLLDAPKKDQDETLHNLELTAQQRFANALPGLLTDEQIDKVGDMRKEGKSNDEILQWVEEQIPEYDEMIRAIIQDIAEEVAEE